MSSRGTIQQTVWPLLVLSSTLAIGCEFETRGVCEIPAAAHYVETIHIGGLYAGPGESREMRDGPPRADAVEIGEGKRLYEWFGCPGCHGMGGGAIGPPLMDDTWIYGSEPANIFASIVQGRPNGMPIYAGRIADHQVWKIVFYVRSMSGNVPRHIAPGRRDGMHVKEPEFLKEPEPERQAPAPHP